MLRGGRVRRYAAEDKRSDIYKTFKKDSKADSGAIIGHRTLNQIWFSRKKNPSREARESFQLLRARRKLFCIDLLTAPLVLAYKGAT